MVKIKLAILLFIFPVMASAITDKEVMTQARGQFENGNIKKAIELYSKIPPQSDFWLESIEERAWGWTRLNEYENALADLQSVTSPVWSAQVGPETYMLSSFVSLKMCNYKEVLNKINLFKKRMLVRVDALEKLLQQPMTLEFANLASSIKDSKLNLVQLGQSAELYPRYFFRDAQLIQALKEKQNSAAGVRMKKLAQEDLKEIQNNLKKMKLIEVEMMQSVLMNKDPKSSNEKLEFTGINKNTKLLFPVTDDEVWLDEVGQFQVRAQKCPTFKGASL